MAKNKTDNEKILLDALVAGNEKAFTSLFNAYYDDLYRYGLSMVTTEDYAAEIVQDVFTGVWRNRASLDSVLSIRAYLFTATRNRAISFLKKAANNKKLREEIFYKRQESVNSTERYIREAELEILKQEALDLLPPKRRQIFEMSRNEGMSYEEIARELKISPNTVRNQISTALETLRDFLLNNRDISLVLFLFSRNWL